MDNASIASLRTSLQHLCPNLRNLTNNDLVECKWVIRKRVLLEMFDCIPALTDFNQLILALVERRESEMNEQRKENANREQRAETEQIFRTSLLRIVCDALTHFAWPPCMEAFSDPLDSLYHEQPVFLDALTHIMKAVAGISPPKISSSRGSSRQTPRAVVSKADPEHAFENTTPSSKKKKSGSQSKIATPSLGSCNTLPLHDSPASIEFMHVQNCDSSEATISLPSSRDVSMISMPISGLSTTMDTDTREVSEDANLDPKLYSSRAMELLQHQNMELTRKLKVTMAAVKKREAAEAKMTAIIAELKMSIDEISGVSNGANPLDYKDYDADNIIEDDPRTAAFEPSPKRASRPSVGGSRNTRVGKPKATNDDSMNSKASGRVRSSPSLPQSAGNGSSSSVTGTSSIWLQVQRKIENVKGQWEHAVREARSITSSCLSIPRETESYLMTNQSTRRNSSSFLSRREIRGDTGMNSDSRAHGSSILTHQLLGIGGKKEQSLSFDSYDDTGPSSSIPFDLHRIHMLQRDLVSLAESANSMLQDLSDFNKTDTSYISSMNRKSPDRHDVGSSSGNQRGPRSGLGSGLGTPQRVVDRSHLGNEDVPSLPPPRGGKSAFTSPPGKAMGIYGTDVLPTSAAEKEWRSRVRLFSARAEELNMHLAALAPITPLALDPSKTCLGSDCSGLDALVRDVHDIMQTQLRQGPLSKEAKKQLRVNEERIQKSADRAYSEQLTTIRMLLVARQGLQQWADGADRTTPLLDKFSSRAKKSYVRTVSGIKNLAESLRTIRKCLYAAEDCREVRDRVDVAPLDALSRGASGREVAELVNALRIHMDDLGALSDSLEVLLGSFENDITREIEALKRARVSLNEAASTNRSS